ncbi:hypothetical protein Y032_0033g2725 [Ancylostoma ceylanicum]|uniref:Uncharacterized protein n=1 Tax=Ancylostoma ceylanicum TaxID=53326 RepID=A0A016UNZ2_9BILA|nr:hypothetical protein Y032_0033g2725 [Ancylostoma ceylanicum]
MECALSAGNGQQSTGIFSNISTNSQQQQQQQQRPGPIPQSGAQSFTPTLPQQPSQQTGQGNGPVHQQGSSTFVPISQQGYNPQYMEQNTGGGQRDFPRTQFQPTTMENGSPNNQIQPTSSASGVYNNQFQLVTPDIRAYGNEYQPQSGPGRGSYNSPNAGYQAPPTNFYPSATGEFAPVPGQMVNQPVTSRPNTYNGVSTGNGPVSGEMLNQPVTPVPVLYNGENTGNSGQYWESSGQFRGDAGVTIPNQSGNNQFMDSEAQSRWTTDRLGYPSQSGSGSAQMQSSTPPNYVNQQQWNGNGGNGMYGPSGVPQSTTPPQFTSQEQWSGGQGMSGSTGPQQQYYEGTVTQPYNDQYISSLQSTTFPPQSMQETSYSNGVPIQGGQRTSPGAPYNGQQFEQSTAGASSQFGTTQPPRTNNPEETFTSTPFQYPVTQNPSAFTPSPDTMSSTLRPYDDQEYSNPTDQRIDGSDGWTPMPSSMENQGGMTNPAFVAPFVFQNNNGQQSQTQGGFQTTQGFMPTTEAPRLTTGNYNNGASFTSAPSGSPTTARYGQNPDGAFVTPTQPAPLQQNFGAAQQSMGTSSSHGQVNDGIATSQSPFMLSTTTRPPGAGPQYDFQNNMNTVYGNYENWPAGSNPGPTQQFRDSTSTTQSQLSSSGNSIAPLVVTALLALLL